MAKDMGFFEELLKDVNNFSVGIGLDEDNSLFISGYRTLSARVAVLSLVPKGGGQFKLWCFRCDHLKPFREEVSSTEYSVVMLPIIG